MQNVMASIKYMLLFAIVLNLLVLASNYSNNCSNYCECDLHNGRNQANCSERNLINAYVEVSAEVEILVLSHNAIMHLDNACFKNFTYLIELDIAFNAIQSIEFDTFAPLRRVESIDLSYNRLESLDNRLFEMNRHLHTLNLEGNKFMFMSNEPLLRSIPLRILNLRNSQLNFLQLQFFTALPQLQQLDISENLLIVLNLNAFDSSTQLLKLNIIGNAWKCEQVQHDVVELRARGVEVMFNDCEKAILDAYVPKEFERMQMDTKSMAKHKWRKIYDNELEENFLIDKNEQQNMCQSPMPKMCLRYKDCLEEILTELEQRLFELQETKESELHSDIELKLAFLLGIAIGLTTSILILTGAFCFKACLDIKKQPLSVAEADIPVSTSRTQRRRARTSQSLAHREPGADNFIARLFGRPARHQYYRAINQNTATLIRRLSRSNLFNNRLGQHFVERNTSENSFTCYVRPETPPPSYTTVQVADEQTNEATANPN